jgi:hypothetical protein
MGMWEGLYLGMQGIRERRDREMDREEARRIREEDMAFRREQFQFQQDTARRQMIAELYPRMRELSANSRTLAEQSSILSGYFSDYPEIVEKLKSTGNTEAIQRVIDSVDAGFIKAEEDGMGQEYLDAWATTIANNANITGATQGELDFTLFENVVTPEDLTALGLPTSFKVPGRIEVAPVIYTPILTPEETNVIENRIARVSIDKGNIEMQRIDSALANISAQLQSSALDEETTTLLRNSQDTLTDRRQRVESALDAASGDRATYSDILGIYGNTAVEQILANNPRANIDALSPSFSEAMSGTPITVTSADQAVLFYRNGVIGENDMIIYNGRQYAVRDLLTD